MDTTNIKENADAAVAQSRSFVNAQIDSRATQAGETLTSIAGDLHRIADELRKSETVPGTADFAQRGADMVDRFGSYLKAADGNQLMVDLETFARNRPWAMAAGALVSGFAASRLLKASSRRRYYVS